MRLIAALGLLVAILPPAPVPAMPAAQPPPTPPVSETNGQLNIVSQSGVEVVWEGTSVGSTDAAGLLVIEGIPPGSYDLLFRKSGYQDRTSRVEVLPGEKSVRMRLQRPPSPDPPPQPRQESKPGPGPEATASADTPTSPAAEPAPSQPEPVATETLAASVSQIPVPQTSVPQASVPQASAAQTSVAAPIERPDATIAETANTQSAQPEIQPEFQPEAQRSTLPPAVYLLGLALLGSLGALAFQWLRRARARVTDLADSAPIVFEPSRDLEAAAPSFLGDIRRREVAMEGLLDAGPARVRRHAVEVMDLGPVEDED